MRQQDSEKPKARWIRTEDRELAKHILDELAATDGEPWTHYGIAENDFLHWRRLLLSPSWSSSWPENQRQAFRRFRAMARHRLRDYAQPSNYKLRTMIDSLAAEQAAKAAGLTTASDVVWTPREILAVAFGLWICRGLPELDDAGERVQLPQGTTFAIQQMLPHRTQATIQNTIYRRHDIITEVYGSILELVHDHGLQWLEQLLSAEALTLNSR